LFAVASGAYAAFETPSSMLFRFAAETGELVAGVSDQVVLEYGIG
jgi:hypothetical protein